MFASHRRPGRAFAVTLAICLIAVATVTVYSLRDSLFAPGPDAESQPAPTTTSTTATTQPHKDVVDPITGVPDDRTEPTTTTTAPTVAADLFVLPVSNTVSAKFSREPVYNATMGDWRTHNGVDFAAEIGDKVTSIADGRVLAIAEDTLWGSLIRIQHGELVATYCGVEADAELKVDDEVKAGERIGRLTIVPCELLDGGHLHLELMAGQDYVDPLTVITGEVKFK